MGGRANLGVVLAKGGGGTAHTARRGRQFERHAQGLLFARLGVLNLCHHAPRQNLLVGEHLVVMQHRPGRNARGLEGGQPLCVALLGQFGLKDRNGDGTLDDTSGKPARFSVLTRKGSTVLERTLANVQEQLGKIGLGLDIVALERNPMLGQWDAGDYEAMYYGAPVSSIDPSNNSDLWLSSGGFHFWAPNQPKPATAWEGQIDQLMGALATTMDSAKRVAMFADVQRILAEHEPIIYFAAPKVTVGMSARVTGAVPAVVQPQVLWRPETLGVGGAIR